MLYFRYSTLIAASVQTVWAFHERADVLQLLTPPGQFIEVLHREGGLAVGAISEFRLRLGVISIQWLATHTVCVPDRCFVDVQTEGPFSNWTHHHLFQEKAGCTQLTDAIAFSLPGNEWGDCIGGELVKTQLLRLFSYRHHVTQNYCQ